MTEIQSSIVEVVVFPDRARVTRHGLLTLDAGIHQLDLRELPLALQPESVRASGRGTASAALLGVDVRRVHFVDTPAIAVQELENQIEALSDQDKALADQAAAAEMHVTFIKKLADQSAEQLARGFALGRSNVEQGGSLIVFMQQQMAQAQATARNLNQQRRELARQLTKLQNDLRANASARARERYSATVEVDVQQAGELTLDLIYMVSNAGWRALYDVRAAGLEGDAASIQWSYLAQVTQQTGEEWGDAALTLSTARPALVSLRPELEPWYIEPYAPTPPQPMMRMAMAAAPSAMHEFPPAATATTTEMEAPSAQINSEGSSVTFKLSQRATIPSDGTPHKVNIATINLKPRLDFVSVPKLAAAAYRRATLNNTSNYLLLPGVANLFVDGDFIGALPSKLIAPNEQFELMLGVDDRVFVERQLMAREVDKKLIGDRRRLRVGYEIEVRNLRADKIALEVCDQIPVARHEQLKVKLESADPKPSEQTELNELKWQLSLAPNEKRFIRFDFSVEHPTGMTVAGLP